MTSASIADTIMSTAASGGARTASGANQYVDLLTVKRKLFSWYSKNALTALGVPKKPGVQSECPVCKNLKDDFQLDHMGPWRVYVAAAGGGAIKSVNGKLMISRATCKALYNDPDNLWWVCSDCNLSKSDKTYDTADQLEELQNGKIPDGAKGVDPGIVFE